MSEPKTALRIVASVRFEIEPLDRGYLVRGFVGYFRMWEVFVDNDKQASAMIGLMRANITRCASTSRTVA